MVAVRLCPIRRNPDPRPIVRRVVSLSILPVMRNTEHITRENRDCLLQAFYFPNYLTSIRELSPLAQAPTFPVSADGSRLLLLAFISKQADDILINDNIIQFGDRVEFPSSANPPCQRSASCRRN